MRNSPHRVRRQRWLVRVGSTRTAFGLRKRLRDDWQGVLLPALDKAFDQEGGGEDVTRIPKIELHLKVASEENIAGLWPALIHEQLVAQLREIVRGRPGLNEKCVVSGKTSAHQSRLQSLLHYLRTGLLTWEAGGISAVEIAVEFKQTCQEQWPELQKLFWDEPAAAAFCFRLLQLIPAPEATAALRALLGEIPFPWQDSLLEIFSLLLAPEQKHFGRYAQLQLAALFLSEAVAARISKTAPDFVRIARWALPLESKALDDFIASLPPSAKEMALGGGKSKPPVSAVGATAVRTPQTAKNVSDLGLPQKDESPAVQSSQRAASKSATGEDFPMLVAHAGLILLHPFLPRFFESTGVKGKTNVELSPFVLPRASALLHFLATGQDAVYEYDVAFIKILLGLNPEASLCVSEGLINDAHKLEAESLLGAVISHWPALKNTSIAGFRSSFLQRRALLREGDGGWRLQVERQPFDMLLEHLPWSISVVKLPWMRRPLYTEW